MRLPLPLRRENRPYFDPARTCHTVLPGEKRARRPQTTRDLAQRLATCPTAHPWTIEDGDAWGSRHARDMQKRSEAAIDASPSLVEGRAVLEQMIDHS